MRLALSHSAFLGYGAIAAMNLVTFGRYLALESNQGTAATLLLQVCVLNIESPAQWPARWTKR